MDMGLIGNPRRREIGLELGRSTLLFPANAILRESCRAIRTLATRNPACVVGSRPSPRRVLFFPLIGTFLTKPNGRI